MMVGIRALSTRSCSSNCIQAMRGKAFGSVAVVGHGDGHIGLDIVRLCINSSRSRYT